MARFNLEDYVEVKDRVKAFNAENPQGAIHAEIVAFTPNLESVIVQAKVWRVKDSGDPDAIDLAQEHKGTHAMVNPTSWVENCATSAIGRALHNLGYGISDGKPSREEMAKVERLSEERPMVQAAQPTLYQQQRDATPVPVSAPQTNADGEILATLPQKRAIVRMGHAVGYTSDQMLEMWGDIEELTKTEASKILDGLSKMMDELKKG